MHHDDDDILTRTVVVGVDDSEAARVALRWALEHAPADTRVSPVITWSAPIGAYPMPAPGMPAPPAPEIFERAAHERGHRGLAGINDARLDDLRTVLGRRGTALADIAVDADAVVVGARTHRGRALLGTTGTRLSKAATVPVVVVPDDTDPDARIDHAVVGIDGSEHAERALRWLLERADPATRITAITTFRIPNAPADLAPSVEVVLRQAAVQALDRTLAAVADLEGADRVRPVVLEGDARAVLTETECDLLVVGSRGFRGIAHLLLGSVATSLISHPPTVTVVVP